MKRLLAHPNKSALPALDAVVEVPTICENGRVLHKPGYDPQSRLLYDPSETALLVEVPDTPTLKDVRLALDILSEALDDFPFTDRASKVNALALMLTLLVRPALKADGRVPLAAIDSPAAGTGKTLLVNVMSLIANGRGAATMSAPGTDDEMRKQLTSQLLRGSTLIVIDNVAGKLSYPSLEQFVTTARWSDRILGKSKTIDLPQSATIVATGNNLQPAGDMVRRCYLIRLDAKMRRPFERTNFRHPDLEEWVIDNRVALIRALLVIARNWYAMGQPPSPKRHKLGGFERWVNGIGGMLAAAGIEGFLENQGKLYEAIDEDDEQWAAFLANLHNSIKLMSGDPTQVTAKSIAREIDKAYKRDEEARTNDEALLVDSLPDSITAALHPNRSLSHAVGKQFTKIRDRRFGDEEWTVVKTGAKQSRAVLWSISRKSE